MSAIFAAVIPALYPSVSCAWFAKCANAATHTQSHPILGEVPICDRCQAKYDGLSA